MTCFDKSADSAARTTFVIVPAIHPIWSLTRLQTEKSGAKVSHNVLIVNHVSTENRCFNFCCVFQTKPATDSTAKLPPWQVA